MWPPAAPPPGTAPVLPLWVLLGGAPLPTWSGSVCEKPAQGSSWSFPRNEADTASDQSTAACLWSNKQLWKSCFFQPFLQHLLKLLGYPALLTERFSLVFCWPACFFRNPAPPPGILCRSAINWASWKQEEWAPLVHTRSSEGHLRTSHCICSSPWPCWPWCSAPSWPEKTLARPLPSRIHAPREETADSLPSPPTRIWPVSSLWPERTSLPSFSPSLPPRHPRSLLLHRCPAGARAGGAGPPSV